MQLREIEQTTHQRQYFWHFSNFELTLYLSNNNLVEMKTNGFELQNVLNLNLTTLITGFSSFS